MMRRRLLVSVGLVALATIGASSPIWWHGAARSASVRVGVAPSIPAGAHRIAAIDPRASIGLIVALKTSHAKRLSQLAAEVSTPSSGSYQRYLGAAQFASQFGAPLSRVRNVERVLSGLGLTRFTVESDRLFIDVLAPARAVERAFSVTLWRYRLPDGSVVYANDRAPRLPSSIAGAVTSVIGLDSLGKLSANVNVVRHFETNRPVSRSTNAPSTRYTATPAGTCGNAAARAGFTADQIAQGYGFEGLYGVGDLGANATIGLIEFAPYIPSDIATFDACYGINDSVLAFSVDNAPVTTTQNNFGAGDQVETELDIEILSALAPQATIKVFDGPRNASNAQALSTYMAAINDPSVQVISTSWGDCETDLGVPQAEAEAVLFVQAAAEGKTFVAASGDEGSEDCLGILKASNPEASALAVDDPASQWYVTGVGGTVIQSLGPPVREAVWNSGRAGGASGGGVSQIWSMPPYQSAAPGILGVVGSFSRCPLNPGMCREVPDVSADAGSPFAIYCTESGSHGCAGGWTGLGGTSLSAPIWGALSALANESASCGGTPIGFANPLLYAIAGGPQSTSAFDTVTSGNNDLGYHGGQYVAKFGYSLAAGLGTPKTGDGVSNDTGLVTQLCDSPRVSTFPAALLASLGGAATVPSIQHVRPAVGGGAGNESVTIIGTNFVAVEGVRFGNRRARSFRVASPDRIVAISPTGHGLVRVEVTNALGTSKRVRADRFRYAARPVVISASPRQGPHDGGTMVEIVGSSLTAASLVDFGTHPASKLVVVSPSKVMAMAPPGSGSIAITVTTPGGQSAPTPSATYRYS